MVEQLGSTTGIDPFIILGLEQFQASKGFGVGCRRPSRVKFFGQANPEEMVDADTDSDKN